MQKSIKKVLVIGRGGKYDGQKKSMDCEELQSCLAIIEEECEPVLFTNACTEPMMDAVVNIPVYQLPFTNSFVDEIVEKEEPDAVYAPFVGSEGWKLMRRLSEKGYWTERSIHVLDDVSIKGRSLDALRQLRKAIANASLRQCQRVEVSSWQEAQDIPQTLGGFPVVLRSAEEGVSIAQNEEEYRLQLLLNLKRSPEHKTIIEECLSGWKSVSVGVFKDRRGLVKVMQTAENIMPIGVHNDDSMSVSPVQTLYDDQKQFIIGASLELAKALDDFVGYCTIHFAFDPHTDTVLVSGVDFSLDRLAEVSLISGYPLVKMVTKLAMGKSLSELGLAIGLSKKRDNERRLLLKVPQFNLNRMGNGNGVLDSHAKSSADKIYVGQNFCQAFRKAWCDERTLLAHLENREENIELQKHLLNSYWDQIYHIYRAFEIGYAVSEVADFTGIDPWFLQQIQLIVEIEQRLQRESLSSISKEQWTTLKLFGFTDSHIARELSQNESGEQYSESMVRSQREYFDTYPSVLCFGCRQDDIIEPTKKIMVLTAAEDSTSKSEKPPLEVPAFVLAKEAKQMGFTVVLVNSNINAIPFWMTLADHLYIEPLHWEIVYEIYRKENPSGIFIEEGKAMPVELEKYFSKIGASIVKVPLELTGRMVNKNSA